MAWLIILSTLEVQGNIFEGKCDDRSLTRHGFRFIASIKIKIMRWLKEYSLFVVILVYYLLAGAITGKALIM